MHEAQLGRVQERPPQRERITRAAVGGVTDHGMLDRGEVHADLVRAPRLEMACEQAADRRRELRLYFVARARFASFVAYRHARAACFGTTDRRVDDTALRVEHAPHERDVRALDR